MKYLAKFEGNYADEFDVRESLIVDEKEYEWIKKYLAVDKIKCHNERRLNSNYDYDYHEELLSIEYEDFYFSSSIGTNEEMRYYGFEGMTALWEDLRFLPITDEEADVLKKFDVLHGRIIGNLIEDAVNFAIEAEN